MAEFRQQRQRIILCRKGVMRTQIRRKNCINCVHLEWYEKETPESFERSGYICNKREYKTEREEDNHLMQLENQNYLDAPKKCCVPTQGEK